MKLTHFFTVVTFGAVMWISCQPKQEEVPEVTQSITEKIELKKFALRIKSDPLPIDTAAIMISNGLQEKFLEVMGRRLSISGYFSSTEFMVTAPNVGIILWPCYNPDGDNDHPTFFLVAEQVQQYDSTAIENNKPGSNLIMPIEVTKYSKLYTDRVTVEAEVLAGKNTMANTAYMPIERTTAIKYIENFEKLMLNFSPQYGTSLCRYGQYFFLKNSGYDNFMHPQDLEYVYYYMGFAWDDDHKPNYYRPILVGVRSDGTTIEDNPYAVNGYPFLQKSVPPPYN